MVRSLPVILATTATRHSMNDSRALAHKIGPLTWVCALLCASCVGTRKLADPTLQIRSAHGSELGVSTDYGIVFLGRTTQAGNVEISAWFGDGLDIEPAAVEPIGDGLFTAETEIRLPQVQMSFDDPAPGDRLLVMGRNKDGAWQREVTVESDPRVLGILSRFRASSKTRPIKSARACTSSRRTTATTNGSSDWFRAACICRRRTASASS